MKVVIGDMTFAEEPANGTPASWDYGIGWAKFHQLQERVEKNYDKFLEVAKACYIARYATPPERTTKDEL